MLDASSDQIFLSVSHHEDLPKLTNIYMSDAGDSASFTVSLLNNVRSEDSGVSLCVTNQVFAISRSSRASRESTSPTSTIIRRWRSSNLGDTRAPPNANPSREVNLIAWMPTASPSSRLTGVVSGIPSRRPNLMLEVSHSTATGIVVCICVARPPTSRFIAATNPSALLWLQAIQVLGNHHLITGLYQSTKDDDFNTYLSRDGGHNWFQIIQGSHIYEIGDHGGLITFAQ